MEMDELVERLVGVEGRINNLEDWQGRQNGALGRLETKVDGLYKWLIGLMSGVITSLLLLIVQILAGR